MHQSYRGFSETNIRNTILKMDIVTPEKRSEMMSGIRGKDTRPELMVRKYLHGLGFRFRLQKRIGKARPDLVLPKWKTCVFIHGCYWHRHTGCKLASVPKSNSKFWVEKFAANVQRDKKNTEELEAIGWSVGIIWECNVRSGKFRETDLSSLIAEERSWVI